MKSLKPVISGFITLWGAFSQHSLGPLLLLEGRDPANQYEVVLSDYMVKHFYPDGSDHFQRNNVSIHRVTGVTEQFDDDENRMPDLNEYL